MSLKDCVASALAQGQITKEEADQLNKRYDNLARRILDPTKIKGQITAELAAEAAEKQRRAGLMEATRKRLVDAIQTFRKPNGEMDMARALMFLHEHFGEATFTDAENLKRTIIGDAHAKLDELLHEFRRGVVLGDLRRNRSIGNKKTLARMDNVVRELFGKSTGDPYAKALAEAWSEVAEDLRVRFNEAGGNVGKLDKWGLPQWHNQEALLHIGQDAWVDRMMQPGVLDRDKMLHPLSKQPMTDVELRESLGVVWERITTDGWSDREASGVPTGKGALFSHHADHRFLHFKDADSWLAYARDFGNPDPYSAMMGHISMMARDIAHMEVFGPEPTLMRNYLKQVILKSAMQAGNPDSVMKTLQRADDMWAIQRGSMNVPVDSRIANGLNAGRSFITASVLGGAQIAALSDAGFGSVTRGFVGMARSRSSVFRVLYETMKHFSTMNTREAVRAGLILDSALHVMHQQSRYAGSLNTRSITGFLADRVITWQGLSAWTQAGKHAFGLAMQGTFADHVGQAWGDLPFRLRSTLERHGFDSGAWDQLRSAGLYRRQGAEFLRPAEVRTAVGRELAERYTMMILRETRYAVPEASVRSQSLVTTTRPGSIAGELSRSFAQFKSFGIAVVMLNQSRIASEIGAGRKAAGAYYAGALLLTGTVLGAIAMGLKDIAAGRDPRKWTDEKTYLDPNMWGAAILQAGGLGIYGDFLFSQVNRFGGGLAETAAGPLWQRVDDVRNLTIGNAIELAQGKKTNAGREVVRFLRGNTPGGTLWYLRLAYERVLLDQLQYMVDPDASRVFRRQVQNRLREYGNGYWWAPGTTAPQSVPNLNVLSTR